MTTYGICSDHAGYALKEQVKKMLDELQIQYIDYGTPSEERCDYPDFAHLLALGLQARVIERGIAICGTGNGMAITLNKYPHIRAGLAWSADIGSLIRAHNDANVLVLPARFITVETAREILDSYVQGTFEGGRHTERIAKINPPQGC